jgi:hypothetical protein
MTKHTDPQTLKSFAGSVLIGPGLFLQFGHLSRAIDQVSRPVSDAAREGLGLLSSIALASTFGQHHLFHQLLLVFWPVLLIVIGALLLWDASTTHAASVTTPESAPAPLRNSNTHPAPRAWPWNSL